jgi:hypothetical protein
VRVVALITAPPAFADTFKAAANVNFNGVVARGTKGTKWTLADRCDATLTYDITDSVSVNDFVHRTRAILRPGQSYLAKKP